jgi:NosR/NirI family nitrous oxide reductase transcriptional regulator
MLKKYFQKVLQKSFEIFVMTLFMMTFSAHALFVSPPKDPLPLIHEIFPEATFISEKIGDPLIKTIYKDKNVIGYAFETNDIAKNSAYSGEPVNMLIAIDTKGVYLGAKVLEHHEPIILAEFRKVNYISLPINIMGSR